MPAQLVSEEFVEDDAGAATRFWSQQPTAEPPAAEPRVQVSKIVLDSMAAMASLLTVRLALLLTVIGTFVLALQVVGHPSTPALVALGIFSLLICPLAWLSQKRPV